MTDRLAGGCSGAVDRRTWMQVGGLSFGSLAVGLQPSLANLIAEQAAGSSALDRDFSVILFWANGGPSHIDLFDLKPDAPSEYRGPFRPIRTNVSGMQISEELPALAKLADKFTLIRSLHHNRNQHSGGTHRFITGYSSRASDLKDSEFPEIGSIVAHQLPNRRFGVPTFVANTKLYGSGPAYLGGSFAPYMPTPNPLTSTGNNIYDPVPIYRREGVDDVLSITAEGSLRLGRRAGLRQELDALARGVQGGQAQEFDDNRRKAVTMLSARHTREAFDVSRESEKTRAAYGNTHWGKSLLVCRRLVEAGVRFVQCQATYRLRPQTGVTSNWDDHSVNSHIFDAYREKLPSFDQSVSAMIQDLYDRGLDRHVLFLFCGEFGRTPKIANQDASGRPGRDHWARAMSVLAAGGGLRMGQVIGATGPKAEDPVDRAMDSNCLLATIYRRFGIDPHRHLLDRSGRPWPILPHGEPIRELL